MNGTIGKAIRSSLPGIVTACGENIAEIWHFGSSRYSAVYNDIDLALVCTSGAALTSVVSKLQSDSWNAVIGDDYKKVSDNTLHLVILSSDAWHSPSLIARSVRNGCLIWKRHDSE